MRLCGIGVLVLSLFLEVPSWPQQAISSQPSQSPSAAPQDPQAVAVLNQALAVTGGAAAIKAITDYTATGNVTYHWNPDEQGTVTIQGLGLSEIRTDASLPSGVHSESIHDGQTSIKFQNGVLWQYPPSYPPPSSDVFLYQPSMFPGSLALPHLLLAAASNNPRFSLSYKGIVQVDGQPAHDVQVRFTPPGGMQPDQIAEYHTVEFFIDENTLNVTMMQENVPKHVVHQIRYSNYTRVSGVLVPFSISEQTDGQKTREIELGQIKFNTGLQESAFLIQ